MNYTLWGTILLFSTTCEAFKLYKYDTILKRPFYSPYSKSAFNQVDNMYFNNKPDEHRDIYSLLTLQERFTRTETKLHLIEHSSVTCTPPSTVTFCLWVLGLWTGQFIYWILKTHAPRWVSKTFFEDNDISL